MWINTQLNTENFNNEYCKYLFGGWAPLKHFASVFDSDKIVFHAIDKAFVQKLLQMFVIPWILSNGCIMKYWHWQQSPFSFSLCERQPSFNHQMDKLARKMMIIFHVCAWFKLQNPKCSIFVSTTVALCTTILYKFLRNLNHLLALIISMESMGIFVFHQFTFRANIL